jgi:hypothetical protein
MEIALASEETRTLSSPRRRYGPFARMLFWLLDLVYGQARSIPKFKVLELIARVPYQSWEQVAYVAMTHVHRQPEKMARIFDFVRESRAQQDNEQWHLLLMEEWVARSGVPQGMFRFGILPQIIAFTYYHLSWLLYAIEPALSYRLNADFEDHAEHEYMLYVREHPELDQLPFDSRLAQGYGNFATYGDALRQIALDERKHKEESLKRLQQPRFE